MSRLMDEAPRCPRLSVDEAEAIQRLYDAAAAHQVALATTHHHLMSEAVCAALDELRDLCGDEA